MKNTYNVVTFTSNGRVLDMAVCQDHDLHACIESHATGLRLAGITGGVARVRHGYASQAAANLVAFGSADGYQGGNLSETARHCGRCGGQGMGQYPHIEGGRCFDCGAPPAPCFGSPVGLN